MAKSDIEQKLANQDALIERAAAVLAEADLPSYCVAALDGGGQLVLEIGGEMTIETAIGVLERAKHELLKGLSAMDETADDDGEETDIPW